MATAPGNEGHAEMLQRTIAYISDKHEFIFMVPEP
jgi:hypothetical protein